jgi:hypothetical protein
MDHQVQGSLIIIVRTSVILRIPPDLKIELEYMVYEARTAQMEKELGICMQFLSIILWPLLSGTSMAPCGILRSNP